MKLRSNEPYWLLKNGLTHSYPSLQENIVCDILIIGGGITGSLMAYQLAGEGYQTVVVDQRDIATGSTSATTAMIQYEIDEPLHSLIKKIGAKPAIDSYKEGVLAIDKLEHIVKTIHSSCNFERKESLFVAATPEDNLWLQDEYLCRKANQLEVSWLDHVQLENQYGISGEGAILSTAGASLDAYLFTHELLAYSIKNFGLKVFDHTEVASIKYATENCTVQTNNKCVIKCKYIVNASGYESLSFLKKKIVKLISTYALVSEPLTTLPVALQKSILWNTEDPYLYMRATHDNRILIGGGDEHFKNASIRDKLIEKKEQTLMDKALKLIPNMKLIGDFSWAGTFGITNDSLPYIGAHPDFPNCYFVLGFGGNGITFSLIGMNMISDALKGRPNRFLEYYKFNR